MRTAEYSAGSGAGNDLPRLLPSDPLPLLPLGPVAGRRPPARGLGRAIEHGPDGVEPDLQSIEAPHVLGVEPLVDPDDRDNPGKPGLIPDELSALAGGEER